MNLIAKILTSEHVLLDLDVESKEYLFDHVGLLLEHTKGLPRSAVLDCLFAREKLGSTGLGQGVAIPHGRARGLKEAIGVFVRLKTPIPFGAPDGKPVQCLFVLLVPEQATDLHLQVLSELAKLFSSRQIRERMLAISTREELFQLLKSWVFNA